MMIGDINYVANIMPSSTTGDNEIYNNNNQQQPISSYEQNNNNLPRIETPAIDYNEPYDCNNGNTLCLSEDVFDFEKIPISALSEKSKLLLSRRLNAIKVILSEDGLPRDYRGILLRINLNDHLSALKNKLDKTKEVLDLWRRYEHETGIPDSTIGRLRCFLGNIDRWDVVDDTHDYFGKQIKRQAKNFNIYY